MGLSLINERPIFGTPGLSMASPYSLYWDYGNINDFVPKVELSAGVSFLRSWAFGFNATWNSMGAESITINRHALDGWGTLQNPMSPDFSVDLFLSKSFGDKDSTRSSVTLSCVGINSLTHIDFAEYSEQYLLDTQRPYSLAYYPISLGLAYSPRPLFVGGTGLRWHFQFKKELYVAPFTGWHQWGYAFSRPGKWNFDKLAAATVDFAWSFSAGTEILAAPKFALRSRLSLGRGVDESVEWDEDAGPISSFYPQERRNNIVREPALYQLSLGNSICWKSQYFNLELGVAIFPPFGWVRDADGNGSLNHARVPLTQFGFSLTRDFRLERTTRIHAWNSIAELVRGTAIKPRYDRGIRRSRRKILREERKELRIVREVERERRVAAERNEEKASTSDLRLTVADSVLPVERIAIVPLERSPCEGESSIPTALASFAESRLLDVYDVVERRHFEAILDEQRLALSGILFENTAVEAGCNLGAQGVVFVESQCLFDDEILNLKLVDCQTSQIQWSATGSAKGATDFFDELVLQLQLPKD